MYNNNLNELRKSKIYFQINVQDLVFQIYIETFRYMFEPKTLVSIISSITLIIFRPFLSCSTLGADNQMRFGMFESLNDFNEHIWI